MIYVLSGGGAGLNFRVLGGTSAPTNPKENDIWVNTDAEITSWEFSVTQPENPSEGMVWFQTSKGSLSSFNALKKNNISVYPTACKQYVSGAWASKTAETYQVGQWKGWVTYLYNRGDQCEDITGGWNNKYRAGDWNGPDSVAQFLEDRVVITGVTNHTYGGFGTVNKVDLTDFSKMYVKCWGPTAYFWMCVSNQVYDVNGANNAAKLQVKNSEEGQVYALDISSLTGEYYIGVISAPDDKPGYVTEVYLGM